MDRTPYYIIAMVAIVALVSVFTMLTHTSSSSVSIPEAEPVETGPAITGNVVYAEGVAPGLNIFGKIFFGMFLVGIAVYSYHKI